MSGHEPPYAMKLPFAFTLCISLFPAIALAQTPDQPAAQKAARLDEKVYDHFGDGITAGDNTPVTKALANPAEFLGKTIRLEGAIDEICQKKGCWMLLGGKERPLFVKFKDYAFFMPLDGAGRTAIVEGTMAMKQETVEQTKHYLEDAGKHDEAAKVTEGRKIYTFMASGVALKKRETADKK